MQRAAKYGASIMNEWIEIVGKTIIAVIMIVVALALSWGILGLICGLICEAAFGAGLVGKWIALGLVVLSTIIGTLYWWVNDV